ncbi:LpqB family beta-propeller domain-containing protein [Glycomyces tarimensis]
MRNKVAAVAAACAAAPMLVSCGIPDSSAPEAIQSAPTDFDQSSSVEAELFLPTTDASGTVQNFLRAAAGDPEGRDERLLEFTDEGQEFSELAEGIGLLDNVDYHLGDGANLETITVTVTGSVTATYLPDGQVRMNTPPRDYEEDFVLERDGLQENWNIRVLPQQVMMLGSQFAGSYVQAPLYFQATGAVGQTEVLVPDLRWVYDSLDATRDATIRLGWLLQGTSEWVRQSARSAIPSGTDAQAITEDEDGAVEIDLRPGQTTEIDDGTIDAIAAQVVWSLGLTGEFTLLIDGEAVASGTLQDWRDWNAIPPGGDTSEIGYFIAEDTVWRFENDQVANTSADHPWVGFSTPGLEQVAVARDHRIAAIVSSSEGDTLQVGAVGNMTTFEGLSGNLNDPQWVGPDTLILIEDGVLTAVDTGSGGVQVLSGEDVTALSAAPDGRRLLYVEGDHAWAVQLGHDADGNLQIGNPPRRIGLNISQVTDVAWSSEDFVWVAGVSPSSDEKLFRVAIDNAQVEAQSGTASLPLPERIAASPADPVDPGQNRGEPNIVVSNNQLYRVFSVAVDPVEDGDGEFVHGSAPFTVPE